jgi:hypothetical protein
MTMAFVTLAAASSEGDHATPVVSKAVTTGAPGAFLVAAIGFAERRQLPGSDDLARCQPNPRDRQLLSL